MFRAGGLRNQIELFRLPEPAAQTRHASFSLPLKNLRAGDNPVYIKVVQQDGHLAWSSPVYLQSMELGE